jgi:PAS domain S-box-containing protein
VNPATPRRPDGRRAATGSARPELQAVLAALFKDAPVGLAVFDADLRFVAVNEAMATVSGVPAAEHVGRYVADVLPEIDEGAVAALHHVLRTGEPLRDVEIRGRTPASVTYQTWLEDFVQLRAPDGAVLGVASVLSDVTAERRNERRLRQLIDSLFTFVGLCLPDGTLVEASRSALDAGGLAPDDVLGRKVWETPWWAWNEMVAQRLREAIDRARAGEASRYDVEVMMADGLMTIDFQLVPVVEDGEVVALVPSATDITGRRRSADQSAAAARLAAMLNTATSVTEVADAIREHSQDAVGGRWATLALLDESGDRLHLLQPPRLPEPVVREYRSLPLDSPNHVARCVRTRTTIIVADPLAPGDVAGSPKEFERLRKARAEAGVQVSAATPLVAADGTMLGALGMGWPRIDDLDAERLDRFRALADVCGQAVERARLSDARATADRRSQALTALAKALASAVWLDEVSEVTCRLAPAVVDAAVVFLRLLAPEAGLLERRLPAGLPIGWRLTEPQPLTAHRPMCDAVRTGERILLSTPAEHEQRYPGLRAELGTPDLAASATLPLRDNADRIIGAIAFAWTTPVRFDPVLSATLDTIAEMSGQTIERARLHAAEHELVASLQRRLLRPMPTVPGIGVHAVYRAAETAVGIGGDFHDGLVLPSGQLAVVLGDVAGHGMEAAADMAQLRTLLSTLLAAGVPLDRLFAQADAALGQVATLTLATAVAAVVDPAGRTLSYVHAGHPPLVLRAPDGTTTTLPDARGGLLGAGIAEAPSATVPFEPGSVLVGYTDGLVENRAAALDEGIAELVDAVAATSAADPDLDAARIAAAVVDRCIGDRRLTDDVALLVVTSPRRRAM